MIPPRPQSGALDRTIGLFDDALRTLTGTLPPASRPLPSGDAVDATSRGSRARSAGLMRVNHAGEVSAQALYRGQAVAARDPALRRRLAESAVQETDHLIWCRQRLRELEAAPSRLDPLWYAGSFALGALAGLAGDRWSLGFLAETEHQVVEHLEGHLARLPAGDQRSRRILEQMHADEGHHARVAEAAGAAPLPRPIRRAMRCAARVMTTTAYWI